MSANLIILGITVLISLYAFSNTAFLVKMMLNPYSVKHQGEYHRLVTSGFVHADFFHLFFNAFTLYNFGDFVEQVFIQRMGEDDPRMGSIAYLLFYVVAVVISDIPTFLKNKNNRNYNSLGASGAVSAVVFGAILFVPTSTLTVMIFPMPAFIFAILYLAFTYYEMRRGNGFINHSAHWYGAVFGMLTMIILYPQVLPSFFNQILAWRPF